MSAARQDHPEARPGRLAASLAALCLLAFAAAAAALIFSRQTGGVAALWPANAVTLAFVCRSRGRARVAHLLAGFLGNLAAVVCVDTVARLSLDSAVGLASANLLEVAICAGLIARGGTAPDLTSKRGLILFVAAAGVAGPAASALLAAITLTLTRHAPFAAIFGHWYLRNALGLLVVAPALLSVSAQGVERMAAALRGGRGVFGFAAFAATLCVVFGQSSYPLFFLIPPALIYVAFELGQEGAAVGILIAALTASIATLAGHGPAMLIHGGIEARLAVLEVFLATSTLAILPVSAALARRAKLEDALRASLVTAEDSEGRYRLLADSSTDVVLKVGHDGVIQYASPSASRFGYASGTLVGRPVQALVHPDDRAKLTFMTRELYAGRPLEAGFDASYRCRLANGSFAVMEGAAVVIRDEWGQPVSVISQLRDVSERRAATLALEASEARYRLLTHNAADVIACYGRDTIFTFLSPSVLAVLGYGPEELIGLPTTRIMHPDDVKPALAAFAAHLAKDNDEAPFRFEYRAFRKDGVLVWLEAHPRVVRDSAGAFVEFQDVVRDITERKRVEAALAESEARHRAIAENVSDIITRCRPDGSILYVSRSVQDVLGVDAAALEGSNFFSLIHEEDLAPAAEAYRQILTGTRAAVAPLLFRLRAGSGVYLWMESSPTLVRGLHGEPTEVISVTRDITARVALEDGLREARDAAQAAAAAKSDFLANMSHEIRTPLTAIIGFAKMLSLHGRYDETAERYIARVARAGETLLSLVNDVLDFSKLEAGQVELAAAPCDLEAMLSDAVLMFAAQAEAKGLVLSFSPIGDLPPRVLLDAGRVRQIVMNLVGNAIKFTVQGEVRVTVRHTAGRLQLEVADSGQGISAAQQRRLFQRFSQADASTTRKHGGTGLGLAICKGLVDAMNGVITVVSAEGDGAVFKVDVPAPCLSEADRMDGPQWPQLSGVRVLALCADAVEAAPLRAVLGSLGVDATFAPASEAAQTADASPFDVLILGALEPRLLARLNALEGVNAGVPALQLGSAPLGGPLNSTALAQALLGALELAASPSPPSAISATAA